MPLFALYLPDGTRYPTFLPAADLDTALQVTAVMSKENGERYTIRQVNRRERRAMQAKR